MPSRAAAIGELLKWGLDRLIAFAEEGTTSSRRTETLLVHRRIHAAPGGPPPKLSGSSPADGGARQNTGCGRYRENVHRHGAPASGASGCQRRRPLVKRPLSLRNGAPSRPPFRLSFQGSDERRWISASGSVLKSLILGRDCVGVAHPANTDPVFGAVVLPGVNRCALTVASCLVGPEDEDFARP
jgi:hypothetical protein